MTGILTPDATCNYDTIGWLNGKGYCRRADSGYHIWWDGVDSWIVSVLPGVLGTNYWKRTDPSILGVYAPLGTAVGVATVGEGTHP